MPLPRLVQLRFIFFCCVHFPPRAFSCRVLVLAAPDVVHSFLLCPLCVQAYAKYEGMLSSSGGAAGADPTDTESEDESSDEDAEESKM